MPHAVEISLAPGRTDEVLAAVKDVPGVVGVSVNRGASTKPPGDVIKIQASNDAARAVLKELARRDILSHGSVTTSALGSVASRDGDELLLKESSEGLWEEIGYLLRRETNLAPNYLWLMALSGMIVGAGLWSDTLHLVLGGVILAPGFEMLLRLPYALFTDGRRTGWGGLTSLLGGYLALGAGAALATVVLRLIDPTAPDALANQDLVQYWSTLHPTAWVLAFAAGAGGALTITAQRPVQSTGALIALALIPAFGVVGVASVYGAWSVALQGLGRWAFDVVAVSIAAFVVLGVKQRGIHRRRELT
jgi:hypothetical protein